MFFKAHKNTQHSVLPRLGDDHRAGDGHLAARASPIPREQAGGDRGVTNSIWTPSSSEHRCLPHDHPGFSHVPHQSLQEVDRDWGVERAEHPIPSRSQFRDLEHFFWQSSTRFSRQRFRSVLVSCCRVSRLHCYERNAAWVLEDDAA